MILLTVPGVRLQFVPGLALCLCLFCRSFSYFSDSSLLLIPIHLPQLGLPSDHFPDLALHQFAPRLGYFVHNRLGLQSLQRVTVQLVQVDLNAFFNGQQSTNVGFYLSRHEKVHIFHSDGPCFVGLKQFVMIVQWLKDGELIITDIVPLIRGGIKVRMIRKLP